MRKDKNQIEIKEPPLGELKKKKSCLKKTCFGGCGCIVILIFGILLALKFASKPRNKELKELPAYFIENVPIYDEEGIHKIEFLSGSRRKELIEKILFIPTKLIGSAKTNLPLTGQKDAYRIEWTELPAQQSFIQNYYKTELKKKGFTIDIASGNEVVEQFTFKKENISGVLYIKDDLIAEGTDYVLLIINIPSQ